MQFIKVCVCTYILLYGIETWRVLKRHVQQPQTFHMHCPRRILGLSWWDTMMHNEILRHTSSQFIEVLLTKKQLRRASHITKMLEERLPR